MNSGFFNKYFLWLCSGIVLIAILFITWVYNERDFRAAEEAALPRFKYIKEIKSGDKIPSVMVASPNGELVDLRKNNGMYTVLNLWATWCTPCVRELPSLKRLEQKFRANNDPWRVIAVSIDLPNNVPKITSYTERLGVVDVANYYDINSELQTALPSSRLPATYILNKSGKVLYEIQGEAMWHDATVYDFITHIDTVR